MPLHTLLDKTLAALTLWFPDLMTRKVAFGATLPVDVLAALIYGLPLVALYGLVRLAVRWFRPPPAPGRTFVMPPLPGTVWPPPPNNSSPQVLPYDP